MKIPTLKELAAMPDEELMDVLGFKKRFEEAKEQIAEMDKLSGKGREHAETRIQEMLTPNVYHSDFKYILDSAKRKNKTGADELKDCSPCSCL